MLENLKNIPILTKLLYLLALLFFALWVVPSMSAYYSEVNDYQNNIAEIEQSVTKYGLENNTKEFSADKFKQNAELLFDAVDVQSLSEGKYKVTMKMKKEDIKKFHTFLEKISLRFYVKVVGALEFNSKEKELEVKMTLLKL